MRSFGPVRGVEGGGRAGGVVARVVEGKVISSAGRHLRKRRRMHVRMKMHIGHIEGLIDTLVGAQSLSDKTLAGWNCMLSAPFAWDP